MAAKTGNTYISANVGANRLGRDNEILRRISNVLHAIQCTI